jgi:quercetin dioxygenase-like cupin family protein
MRRILTTAVLLAAAVPLGLLKSTPAHGEEGMQISPDASRPAAAGSPEFFTGDVLVKPLFNPTEYTKTGGGQVTFSPCARSAWHTHPAGQTLIVTSGTGWVQQWGGEKQQIKPGDVIWTPPGVKHWHGATATESMTHTAIQDSVDGRNVDWMEKVADDEYMS